MQTLRKKVMDDDGSLIATVVGEGPMTLQAGHWSWDPKVKPKW